MTDDQNNIVLDKYPKIFVKRPNGRGGYYPFWLECGSGWLPLIETLCRSIQGHVDNQNTSYTYKVKRGEAKEEDRPDFQVVALQVKEKFGGLRFYTAGNDEYVNGLISMAEAMSYQICERCSNPGKVGGKGWITTMCEPCRELDTKRQEEYLVEIEADMAKRKAEQTAKEQNNG